MYIVSDFKIHESEKKNYINKLLSECNIINLKKIYDFFLYELQRNSAVLDNFFTDEKKPIVFNNEKYLRNEILIKAVNEINKSDNNYIELQNIKKILMLKKESHKFYLKKSVNISNSYIKNLALFFADTEYSHIVMLEYIIKNTNLETSRIKKKLTDKVFI